MLLLALLLFAELPTLPRPINGKTLLPAKESKDNIYLDTIFFFFKSEEQLLTAEEQSRWSNEFLPKLLLGLLLEGAVRGKPMPKAFMWLGAGAKPGGGGRLRVAIELFIPRPSPSKSLVQLDTCG